VSFISGAVGTALVARVLESGWLGFPLNPAMTDARTFSYSNLFLVFAVLTVLSGFIYFRSWRKPR
jgi:DHA2 family metal-tetracycline-proton antiporter-like MFS transporter